MVYCFIRMETKFLTFRFSSIGKVKLLLECENFLVQRRFFIEALDFQKI